MTGSDCVPAPELEKRYLESYAKYDYRPYISSAKSLKSGLTGWSGTGHKAYYEDECSCRASIFCGQEFSPVLFLGSSGLEDSPAPLAS